jgi:hypothetical protein
MATYGAGFTLTICQQYPGYFRFAKWMERLAQGIADGVISVPKDH